MICTWYVHCLNDNCVSSIGAMALWFYGSSPCITAPFVDAADHCCLSPTRSCQRSPFQAVFFVKSSVVPCIPVRNQAQPHNWSLVILLMSWDLCFFPLATLSCQPYELKFRGSFSWIHVYFIHIYIYNMRHDTCWGTQFIMWIGKAWFVWSLSQF